MSFELLLPFPQALSQHCIWTDHCNWKHNVCHFEISNCFKLYVQQSCITLLIIKTNSENNGINCKSQTKFDEHNWALFKRYSCHYFSNNSSRPDTREFVSSLTIHWRAQCSPSWESAAQRISSSWTPAPLYNLGLAAGPLRCTPGKLRHNILRLDLHFRGIHIFLNKKTFLKLTWTIQIKLFCGFYLVKVFVCCLSSNSSKHTFQDFWKDSICWIINAFWSHR